MQLIKNDKTRIIGTQRKLTVSYDQLQRLRELDGVNKLSLLQSELPVMFQIDLQDFDDFKEYYRDFEYEIKLTHLWDDDTYDIVIFNVNNNQ